MRTVLFLFIALNGFFVHAQQVKGKKLIALSEMYLKETVGDNLFQYFYFSEPNGTYYKREDSRRGFSRYGRIKANRKLKTDWTEAWLHWFFDYPEIPGVRSGLWVKIDKNLELMEPIGLEFIPSFLWNNEPSNFISTEQAMKIGEIHLTKTAFGRDEPKLTYDSKLNKYVYEIWNRKTQVVDPDGRKHGILEVARIDAVTAEILDITTGYYGKPIIR